MHEERWLAEAFEAQRSRMRSVAYRMLGSLSEADDAVQGTWLRLSRADSDGIENLGGWLTTAVARECLDMLRSASRREVPVDVHVPDPIVTFGDAASPEDESVHAESVGLAMLVVLDTLTPTERLAFVLHDVFAVPHDEIAAILDRSPETARQLASRARRRVRAGATPEGDPARQRQVVDAFLAAARDGDFGALVEILDPDVVLRADGGEQRAHLTRLIEGAEKVARQAAYFSRKFARHAHPALVNGAPGVTVVQGPRTVAVMAFTITGDRIIEINILVDPARLRQLGRCG